MKRHGEDIIITDKGEMTAARKEAAKVSTSKNHSYCNVWYICTQYKNLHRASYREGVLYAEGPSENYWYSATMTILDAILRHAKTDFIRANAKRLLTV